MIIKRINLQNFRNYQKRTFEFEEGINLIVGDNAVGKTNLLEAIYLLASGRSFRVKSVEKEMIQYGEEIARVISQIGLIGPIGQIGDGESKTTKNLEIVLTTGEVGGEKTGKKKYLVDGVPKRGFDFLGNFRTVYFGPEDLELVTDSPSLRRKYLDSVLVQVDREYARCLLAYEKGIRARNKLLESIREQREQKYQTYQGENAGRVGGEGGVGVGGGEGNEDYRRRLYFWDQLVIKNGGVLTEKRGEYLEFLNRESEGIGGRGVGGELRFTIEYDKSLISEERLKQYEREEVASATTLVGPHRDDFAIKIKSTNIEVRNSKETQISKFKDQNQNLELKTENGGQERDLSIYGSRGEQRLAILWLKLGELAYIEKETGDRPVLLLDDIFSELDEGHRELVLELVGKQQTIITTADGGILRELEKIQISKFKYQIQIQNLKL